jgi:hypothetical protein
MLFSLVTSHFLQTNLLLFNSKSSKFKSTKMTIFGFSNKKLFASARPIPLAPPVTTTTLFSILK